MKKYIYVLTVFFFFSCNDVVDLKSNKTEEFQSAQQDFVNDLDFQQVVILDDFIKREILRGTFSLHKDFITKELESKKSHCNILNSNTLDDDLLLFIEAKCKRSNSFRKFATKYPSYLELKSTEKIQLRKKVESHLKIELNDDEKRSLIESRKKIKNEE